MSWPNLILILVDLFGPPALAWLRRLLADAEPGHRPPDDPHWCVFDVFEEARSRLTVWDRLRGRGRLLAAAERVALGRAPELCGRAAGAPQGVPLVLSTAEYEALCG